MIGSGRHAGRAALLALLAAVALGAAASAARLHDHREAQAEGVQATSQPQTEAQPASGLKGWQLHPERLVGNLIAGRVRVNSDAEAAVAARMISAFASVSREIITGQDEEGGGTVSALSMPDVNITGVNTEGLAVKVFASALVSPAHPSARAVPLSAGPGINAWHAPSGAVREQGSAPMAICRIIADHSPGRQPPRQQGPCPAEQPITPALLRAARRMQATWQLGVWDAPSNKGLRPSKFEMFNRTHYYQVGC